MHNETIEFLQRFADEIRFGNPPEEARQANPQEIADTFTECFEDNMDRAVDEDARVKLSNIASDLRSEEARERIAVILGRS